MSSEAMSRNKVEFIVDSLSQGLFSRDVVSRRGLRCQYHWTVLDNWVHRVPHYTAIFMANINETGSR